MIATNYTFRNYYKSDKRIIYFFVGVILYDFFHIINSLYKSTIIIRLPEVIGLLLIIYSSYKLIDFRIKSLQLKILVVIYFIWNFFVIIRFNSSLKEELRFIFFQPMHFFAYFVPLVLLFPYNLMILKIKLKFLIVVGLIFALIYFIIWQIMFPNSNLADLIVYPFYPGAAILYLTWSYHPKWIKYFSVILLILMLYIGLNYGRRNIILISLSFITLGWLLNFWIKESKIYKRFLYLLFAVLTITVIYINFDLKKFERTYNRLSTDSRTEVFLAFYQDINGLEWLIGRGIDGTYFNPINYWDFSNENSREVKYRDNIENGFLYIILKGGIIGLILFLSIVFPAIYLGLFKSNNFLVKALGVYIIIYLISMGAFGQPALSINYILLWISIAICYNKNIRLISEIIMSKYLEQR